MFKIPKFNIYGEGDSQIEEDIQPHLKLRNWTDLKENEKMIALQELKNNGWVKDYSEEIFSCIRLLNYHFLRLCPGKNLHQMKPNDDYRSVGNDYRMWKAAAQDFEYIFLSDNSSESLVFFMLTKFADGHIKKFYFRGLEDEKDEKKRKDNTDAAFETFDRLANCLNHIFEQFSVNAVLTRNGLIPRQDKKITEEVYVPTIKALSDPKWKNVNSDLAQMFDDYQQKNYPETITKAHRVIQRFLQISVGEEGKNSKGEFAELFREAKRQGIIPTDRFSEPIVNVFQNFISSERATKSTAKPTRSEATSADALLIMNVVMVFLQHCVQNLKS